MKGREEERGVERNECKGQDDVEVRLKKINTRDHQDRGE